MKSSLNTIRERIAEELPEAIFYDGYDDCILGTVTRYGAEPCVCYDYQAVIARLQKDMTYEEAVEFFEFNIIGAYTGPHTPCFLNLTLPDSDTLPVISERKVHEKRKTSRKRA